MTGGSHGRAWREGTRDWIEALVAPRAAEFDRSEVIGRDLIATLAHHGCLAATIGSDHGGSPLSSGELGVLMEELSLACSSVRSIVTVHSMVCSAIAKWGTASQRRRWLARLASGQLLAAFALTEPQAGSDIDAIQTRAESKSGGFLLTGRKKWITAAQIADLFLVFAKHQNGPAAFLVQRDTPGLVITPIQGLLGVRASMLASLSFEKCEVPSDALIGRVGFGQAAVAASSLDLGRYCVAWGCVGIARACLDSSVRHVTGRQQFGVALREHQLVRRKIANMVIDVSQARLACANAATLRDGKDPESVIATCMAKYVASTACTRAAKSAVQLHGAIGCSGESSVERLYRDAQTMEIIEGSTQLQQLMIADHELRRPRRESACETLARSSGGRG